MSKYDIPEEIRNRKIYSFSKLSSISNGCEYGYYLSRVKKLKQRDNVWSECGSKVHDLLERMQIKEVDNSDAIEEFNSFLLDLEVRDLDFPTEQIRKNYIKSVLHYMKHYKPIVCDDCKIELKEFLKVGEDKALIGFIDLIIKRGEEIIIIDYKTSSKYSKKDMKANGKQLLIYSEMLKNNYKSIDNVKVGYDFIKYVKVRHKGKKRTKTVLRSKLVVEIRDKIEKDLFEVGIDGIEVSEILLNAISRNEIPTQIIDNYELEPHIVFLDYSAKDVVDLYRWIEEESEKIENKINDKIDWKPINIEKENFFCKNLCGVMEHCDYYKEWYRKQGDDVLDIEGDLF